ncbi:MAG: hypothetical protein NWE77_06060 [Candidatus Bathyarchaeota archaeon]|jgi:predicted RNA binding protein with dsRBD fold (UPF0201 family)|nr:hypothetical protein [Candidatus Bathyarchaeota archaeon]UCD40390.1 MAG: hypothetical protein JSV87_02340 [Candidatus Bathyarchaeota archaeon]
MDKLKIRIIVEKNPTEDPDKVKQAVENIFSTAEFETKPGDNGNPLIANAKGKEGLTKLYNLLRRERIRDAARGVLFKGLKGHFITFYLNKQVAYAGHVSFCQPVAESPLGPIKVQLTCDNPKELIEWLAPRTARGD